MTLPLRPDKKYPGAYIDRSRWIWFKRPLCGGPHCSVCNETIPDGVHWISFGASHPLQVMHLDCATVEEA